MPDTTLITWADHDPSHLPQVEASLSQGGGVIIGDIARVKNSGFELYVPVPYDRENNRAGGGFLELSEAQARHIYNELAHLLLRRSEEGS